MYKRSNHHLQGRSTNGRFERTTLASFGLQTSICPYCGALNAYQTHNYVRQNGFVEKIPNIPPTICEGCQSELNSHSALNTFIMLG